MKNNLSIVLNVVLLIAVAVLYVLHFSNNSAQGEQSEVSGGSLSSKNLSIAYVNSDSLLSKYDYFKDLEVKLIAKRDKLNLEYQNRAEGLQREISNFQNTAGNMTMAQARAVEEDLRKKQQNLMMYQEQLGQQLMGEEQKMNSDLYDKLADYLNDFSSSKNLQIVLTYTKGSGVLYANDSLDITDQVLLGLNDAYKTEIIGGTSAKSDTTKTK